jgi:hypothetical protein
MDNSDYSNTQDDTSDSDYGEEENEKMKIIFLF